MPTARAIIKNHYRKMGKKGGKARAESLTPVERSAIARGAAQTRWAKYYAANPPVEVGK